MEKVFMLVLLKNNFIGDWRVLIEIQYDLKKGRVYNKVYD